jgi:hypothetical protein
LEVFAMKDILKMAGTAILILKILGLFIALILMYRLMEIAMAWEPYEPKDISARAMICILAILMIVGKPEWPKSQEQ